jgi:hypothetical protein
MYHCKLYVPLSLKELIITTLDKLIKFSIQVDNLQVNYRSYNFKWGFF